MKNALWITAALMSAALVACPSQTPEVSTQEPALVASPAQPLEPDVSEPGEGKDEHLTELPTPAKGDLSAKAFASSTVCPAAGLGKYCITEIGSFDRPGATATSGVAAWHLNNNGIVTGSASYPTNASNTMFEAAYRYHAADGTLGDVSANSWFGAPSGTLLDSAVAINDSGQTLMWTWSASKKSASVQAHYSRYALNGFYASTEFMKGWMINKGSRVVGEVKVPASPGLASVRNVPAFWKTTGYGHDGEVAQSLPDSWYDGGAAYGINEGNTVAGTVYKSGTKHAYIWKTNASDTYSSGGSTDLGTLSGNHTEARAINIYNRAVGCSLTGGTELNDDTFSRAFLYVSAVNTIPLMAGYTKNCATSVNDARRVVGVMKNAAGDKRAFFYDPWSGTQHNLNDKIPGGYGWVLEKATAINNNGWIVGLGKRNGQKRAFLLTPKF